MADRAVQNVLLVSSDSDAIRQVQASAAAAAVRGTVIKNIAQATEALEQPQWDLVILDVQVSQSQGDAFDALARCRTNFPERPVLMIGPSGETAAALRAIRDGCRDYLLKPLARLEIDRWFETLLPNHNVPLASCAQESTRYLYQIAGASRPLLETIGMARKVAPSSMPVLVAGESGSGKELISYLIHRQSNRSRGPYIRLNCAAVSESLLESELFGHERGAFTGAIARRKGRFEQAHGGTLLLDEITETGHRLQAELLRVLEQQDFERVGGSESVRVNVRIISTTNRDLAAEVEAGRFRRDLYYRLCGVKLCVPPLRKRPEDIPALVWHFVNQFAPEVRRRITSLDDRMLGLFGRYSWPGNVRQLRNVVRTAIVLGQGPVLSLEGAGSLKDELLGVALPAEEPQPTLQLDELERRTILEALQRTSRNQAKAARLLGITDRTLREKLRRYRQADSQAAESVAIEGFSPDAVEGAIA